MDLHTTFKTVNVCCGSSRYFPKRDQRSRPLLYIQFKLLISFSNFSPVNLILTLPRLKANQFSVIAWVPGTLKIFEGVDGTPSYGNSEHGFIGRIEREVPQQRGSSIPFKPNCLWILDFSDAGRRLNDSVALALVPLAGIC